MPNASIAVSQLFPPDFLQTDKAFQAEVERQGLEKLPGAAWTIIRSDATRQLDGVLNVNAFDLLASGWCKARELQEYANPAQHPATELSNVFLAEHTLSHTSHPEIVITVGQVRLQPIRLMLLLSATVDAAVLTIQNGHILSVRSAVCWAKAQLKLGELTLHKPLQSQQLPLPGNYPFAAPGLRIPPPGAPGSTGD